MRNHKVKKQFRDKYTKEIYSIGSTYASEDKDRVEFLTEEGYLVVEGETLYPNHTGGGWYELSNGEKVKGKDEATTAEEALQKSSGE